MRKSIAFIIISLMTVCATAQNLYIGSFYVTTNTEEKLYGDGKDKWTERQVHISNLFRYEQPDVLGLQGATTTQQSAIRSKINSGLTSVLTYKLAQDILYNKTVELDTCNMVENMPEGSTCSWAKMRKDGKAFYVFNFCFSTENSVATSSASRVRTAIDEINTEGLPVLIVGDLGVNETKSAYNSLKAKYNDCFTTAAVVSAEYGTKNNFDLAANHGTERYDFIFASKSITVKAYGQLQSAYFTQESDGTYKRRQLSTHFPVMAKVTLP